MTKTSSAYPKEIRPGLLHKLSLGQEKTRFEQYLEYARPTADVFRYGFFAGIGKGFGIVIGATLVTSLVVTLLGILSYWVPGDVGKFFQDQYVTLIEALK